MNNLNSIFFIFIIFLSLYSCEKEEGKECEWVFNHCCNSWQRQCTYNNARELTDLQSGNYEIKTSTLNYFPIFRMSFNNPQWGVQYEDEIGARKITHFKVEVYDKYFGDSNISNLPGLQGETAHANYKDKIIYVSKTKTSYRMPRFFSIMGPEGSNIFVQGNINTQNGIPTKGTLKYTNNDETIIEYTFSF